MPTDTIVSWDQIPAEAQAQLAAQQQQEQQSAVPGAQPIDISQVPEDALYELADKQQFDPATWAAENPDFLKDDATSKKMARTFARLKDRGFKIKDVFSTPEDPEPGVASGMWNAAKKAGVGVGDFVKGVFMNAVNLSQSTPAVVGAKVGAGVPLEQALDEKRKAEAESLAAMEGGVVGLGQMARTAGRKAVHNIFETIPYADRPEHEQLKDFLDAVDKENLNVTRSKAEGPFTQMVAGESIEGLKKKGLGPEQERIAAMTGTDPLSLYLFGRVFSGVTALGKLAAPVTKAVEKGVAEVSKKAVGVPLAATGAVVEKTAPAAGAVVGAVKGGELGGPAGALIGGERGLAAGKQVSKGARAVKEFGSQVAGLSPLERTSAVGTRAVLDAFPKFLTDTGAGVGLDLAFVASATETPQEAGQMPLLATGFGAAKGTLAGARKFAISTKYAPDFWKHPDKWAAPFTPDAAFPEFAALHKATAETAPDIQTARVNAVDHFLKQSKSDSPIYFVNDEAALAQALEKAYSQAGFPDAVERAKFAAAQNGLFTENLVDASGKRRKVIIAKNPDSIPHEGFHGIQAILGEAGNRPIDLLTFKAYESVWEQEGKRHTEQLLGQRLPEGADWRAALRENGISNTPDQYLARELAAENFDYAFRAGPERKTGLPGKLANVIFNLSDLLGTRPLEGEKTPVLGIEPRREVVEAVRKPAAAPPEELIPPVAPAPTPAPGPVSPVSPVSPPAEKAPAAEIPEVQKAKDWIDANPTKVPTPETASAGKTVADAITDGGTVRVAYWAAKGTPAGEVTSVRPERRAEIESQRQAENADRQLVEHEFTPYRVEVRSTGPQFVGWSRDILNSNVAKFSEWAKAVEDKSRIPYETDANGLTENGLAQLREDARVYQENQANGYTGAGEKIVVPPEAEKLGAFKPEEKGEPLPLSQERADVINYLFNTKIPESAGRLAPLHLAGQEVSAATKPGRVEVPVRPRGEYPEGTLRKAGIMEPKGVREVNPFRQWVESQSGEKPSLVEVSQRLNLARIEEAQSAGPGVEPVKGNVLTQAAGFQPRTEAFQPGVAEEMKRLVDMPQEEWRTLTANYKGKLGNNLTGWAWDVGAAAKDANDVMALRQTAQQFSELTKAAMAAKDFNKAMEYAGRGQAAREAFEAATGSNLEGTNEGSAVPGIRKYVDPDYKPPVKAEGEAFQPKGESKEIRDLAETYARGVGIDYTPSKPVAKVNEKLAGDIADFYEAAEHSPESPEVKASYDALAKETIDQLKAIQEAGYTIEPFTEKGEPYKSSAEMVDDVRDNKHLYFLKTEGSFGEGGEPTKNLMLEPSGINDWSVNDVFRAVHDFFGHAKEGYQFGPKGELNAWRAHSDMYSGEAQGALAAETLAQNSWVNFGPQVRGRSIPLKDRPFAEQKNIVVPEEIIAEAKGEAYQPKKKDGLKFPKEAIGGFKKAWILPDGTPVQLGGTWHHEWLADNPEVAKKYGLKVPEFTGTDAEQVRESALKKGFARINYSVNTGTLTVEARAKDWRKIRPAVEDMVDRNIGDIDNMTVTLFDDSVLKVVDTDSARLFEMSNREKMQNLPLISKSESRGEAFQPKRLEGEPSDRTSMKYLKETPTFPATGAKGEPHLFDGANFLSEENAKKGRLSGTNDEAKKGISRALAEETLHALENNADAKGWYDRKISETLNKLAELHPELKTDEGRFTLFKAVLAITSNGQAVMENMFRADDVYRQWKDAGTLPTTGNWGGSSSPAINKGMKNLSLLIETKGLEGAREFLQTEFTVKELKKMGYRVVGEKMSSKVRGSMILGPKVGAFFTNLNGDFSPVTMDRWFMRTFNRVRGTLTQTNPKAIVKHIDGLTKALPRKGTDFGFELADVRNDLASLRADVEAGKPLDYARPAIQYVQKRFRDYAKTFEDRNPANRAAKLLNEQLFPIHQHPKSGGERAWVRAVVEDTQKLLKEQGVDLTNADLQALLWYYEKELYKRIGFDNPRAEGVDYSTAASELLRERGGPDGFTGESAQSRPTRARMVRERRKRNPGAVGGEAQGALGLEITERPNY